MHPEAERLVATLGLQPHPEGGYYRETWRSALSTEFDGTGGGPVGPRSCGTAIFYLLAGEDVSRLHRLKADEIFHLYAGGPLAIHILAEGSGYRTVTLGADLEAGQVFQAVIPAGCWFGASLVEPGTFALVGCTVAPGFDFADFEMGDRNALLDVFAEHEEIIRRLT
jgi:predicted cupin superfamily sugar epimerase